MNIVDSSALAQLLERTRLELFTQRTKMEAETDTTVKAELQQEVRRLEQRLDVLKKREIYFRLGRQSWLKRAALDLVQETDSPSLHRFQMMAWTLLLGLVFLDSVYFKLAMPEFDTSLLTLIGISNGAYLGFKFQTSSVTTGANP
jgi:hypothetical protein